MKRFLFISILTISLSLFIGINFALNIPKPDGYVLDQASILSQEQEEILESKIYQARKETDVEIGILIINTLSGEDIFNYSLKVAEERGIGDKTKDNGLFMLFAMQDRERRIQVGYGLEGIITDNIAKRLGEKNIPDNFRAGLYFDGINNTVEDIISYIKQDPETLAYINSNDNNTKPIINSDGELNLFFIIFIFFIVKGVVTEYDKKKKRNKIKKNGRKYFALLGIISSLLAYLLFTPQGILTSLGIGYGVNLLALGLILLTSGKGGNGGGSSYSGSGGGFSSGGFSSGSSGSSFGGFGGGSFGGGGAGGKR